MAIFGRITARQRLRRAAQESLTIPAFSSPIDCTPWVIGGLWPAELSTITPQTATVADHLRDDLQRIARSANDELKIIRRAGMFDPDRKAEEARVIDQARARAVRRAESTLRQLQSPRPAAPAPPAPSASTRAAQRLAETAMERTQVIPAVRDAAPPVRGRHDGFVVDHHALHSVESTAHQDAPVVDSDEPEPAAIPAAISAAAPPPQSQRPAQDYPPPAPTVDTESDADRVGRLLAFVVRQEPRLNWAVGDYADGRTVLVTDLAHGWIPADITLPAGVQLLGPERRTGKVSTLLGDTTRIVTYAPGDSLDWSAELAETEPSVQPRELPPLDDLGRELGQATHLRDGLPRMVHVLAKAAAAGTGVVDDEVDLLRVHLDTAHHQLVAQAPDVDPELLLSCLLFAATEGIVTGDPLSANYHLSWFQKLNAVTCEPLGG